MSIKDGILIENQREADNTRRIIERLKDEKCLPWKPHQKSIVCITTGFPSHCRIAFMGLKTALFFPFFKETTLISS